jgi:hypothetical protein
MAGTYGAGASKAGVNTANTCYFQLRPTATTTRLAITQIIVSIAVAPTTAPAFYLARSTAIGTATTTLAGLPFDPSDAAAVGTFDSVLSVAPTFTTTAWLGSGAMAVTAGGSVVWNFYNPIVVAASTSAGLCIVNANASGATTGTFQCSVMWDE